jgi:hypothetical protein
MIDNEEKYFVYSEMQIDEEKQVCERTGRIFQCGTVSNGSSMVQYSKIIAKDDLDAMVTRYPDTRIVLAEKLANAKYTKVTREFIKESDKPID